MEGKKSTQGTSHGRTHLVKRSFRLLLILFFFSVLFFVVSIISLFGCEGLSFWEQFLFKYPYMKKQHTTTWVCKLAGSSPTAAALQAG